MASKPGFFNYMAAAFSARPIGMFVAPNWIGLAAFGLLGVANPGFWVLGAGLELGYLLTLATNRRFQHTVSARPLSAARERMEPAHPARPRQARSFRPQDVSALAERCRSIIELQVQGATEAPEGIETQADSLGRLSWMFLRLLLARRTISNVLGGDPQRRGSAAEDGVAGAAAATERADRGARGAASPASSTSSGSGRVQRTDGDRKLAYIEAELERIGQQVELIREQAALSHGSRAAVAADRRDHRDTRLRPDSGSAISGRSMARWKIC